MPSEAKRFSTESREALEKEGFVLVELTSRSIKDIHDMATQELRVSWTDWEKGYLGIENLPPSRKSEVAVRPGNIFLPDSGGKKPLVMLKLANEYDQELSQRIMGIQAITGEAADYVDLTFVSFEKTGNHLFTEEFTSKWLNVERRDTLGTLTSTEANLGFITVSCHKAHLTDGSWVHFMSFNHLFTGQANLGCGIAPLVVPK